jgi:hypothetical protein
MKTARNIFFTALLSVIFAMPAMANKKKPIANCPDEARAKNVNGINRHKRFAHLDAYNTPKSNRAIRHKVKTFEKPRHTLNMKFKSPKHKSSTQYTSGGFYSFRRHGYSAHLFHKK